MGGRPRAGAPRRLPGQQQRNGSVHSKRQKFVWKRPPVTFAVCDVFLVIHFNVLFIFSTVRMYSKQVALVNFKYCDNNFDDKTGRYVILSNFEHVAFIPSGIFLVVVYPPQWTNDDEQCTFIFLGTVAILFWEKFQYS